MAAMPALVSSDRPAHNWFHLSKGWKRHPQWKALTASHRVVFYTLLDIVNELWFPDSVQLYEAELADESGTSTRTVWKPRAAANLRTSAARRETCVPSARVPVTEIASALKAVYGWPDVGVARCSWRQIEDNSAVQLPPVQCNGTAEAVCTTPSIWGSACAGDVARETENKGATKTAISPNLRIGASQS